jgi:hypothetical protein
MSRSDTGQGWNKVDERKWQGERQKQAGKRPVGGIRTSADLARAASVCIKSYLESRAASAHTHIGQNAKVRGTCKGLTEMLLFQCQHKRNEGGRFLLLYACVFFSAVE